MKELFDTVSRKGSEIITKEYSTSFSFGILFLNKSIRQPIYNIYGLVRVADEIVDTFHGYDQAAILDDFIEETKKAIDRKISTNPVLHAFQETYHKYGLEWRLVELFFNSMKMDLDKQFYDQQSYEDYILGSAEVVGLMCLKVFVNGDESMYRELKPFAMKLGSAFQKINFLRDVKQDFEDLGRTYFPNVNLMSELSEEEKSQIEDDIQREFEIALIGIRKLPKSSRGGVYLAYRYYLKLFYKIKRTPAKELIGKRIRIANSRKFYLMMESDLKVRLNSLTL